MSTPITVVLCVPDCVATDPDLEAHARALEDRLNGLRVTTHDPGRDGALADTLCRLAEDGTEKIVCLPLVPFLADRMKADLPAQIDTAHAANPDTSITLARAPDIEPDLLRAAQARLEETLGNAPDGPALTETVLVVAGPGAEDAEANAGIAKMARMIWEGMGFAWCEIAFANFAAPTINDALSTASRLGYRRIVVLPYEFTDAGTETAVRAACTQQASRSPGIDFASAVRLGTHPAVTETLAARIGEALGDGAVNAMNCQICSYREQVLALEDGDGEHHHHHHSERGND